MRTNKAESEGMFWGNASLFPPHYILVPALQAIYRMGLGSVWGEEFFKATYSGIPKAEEQMIRLKRNLLFIQGSIYILFCLIFPKQAARNDNPWC